MMNCIIRISKSEYSNHNLSVDLLIDGRYTTGEQCDFIRIRKCSSPVVDFHLECHSNKKGFLNNFVVHDVFDIDFQYPRIS